MSDANERRRTWQAPGLYGHHTVWTMGKCHACKEPTPVAVGTAGKPCCDACLAASLRPEPGGAK